MIASPSWERTPGSPRVAFARAGDQGPPVLFIMGLGMRGAIWGPQLEGLREDHRLLYFDHRGVGKSERHPGARLSIRQLAGDALRVLDAAGHATAHVVGVSMGGMIAQELALRAEPRVRSLTLIATHDGSGRCLPPAEGLRLFALANFRGGEARLDALRRLLYTDEFLSGCDRAILDARLAGPPIPRATFLAQLSAVLRHRTGARLGALRCPTLIIKPERDRLIPPRCSDRLQRRLPHARLLALPGAGHGAIFQEAEAVNAALRQHVRDAESAWSEQAFAPRVSSRAPS